MLFAVGIVVQYFSAGLGLLGGETMQFHKDFGWAALHLFPILMFLIALLSRLSRGLLIMSLALAVVTFLQPIWVAEFRGEFLGGMHLLGALVIAFLARDLAERSFRYWRNNPA
jgi:hypothetical protein